MVSSIIITYCIMYIRIKDNSTNSFHCMSRLFVFIVRFFKLSTTSVSKNFQRARIKDQAWTKLIILLEVVKKRKKSEKYSIWIIWVRIEIHFKVWCGTFRCKEKAIVNYYSTKVGCTLKKLKLKNLNSNITNQLLHHNL